MLSHRARCTEGIELENERMPFGELTTKMTGIMQKEVVKYMLRMGVLDSIFSIGFLGDTKSMLTTFGGGFKQVRQPNLHTDQPPIRPAIRLDHPSIHPATQPFNRLGVWLLALAPLLFPPFWKKRRLCCRRRALTHFKACRVIVIAARTATSTSTFRSSAC